MVRLRSTKRMLGGLEGNKHYNKKEVFTGKTGSKQVVFGLRERGGRVVMRPIPTTQRRLMEDEILLAVEPGATIYTDEAQWYDNLERWYVHRTIRHAGFKYVEHEVELVEETNEIIRRTITTNRIESAWSLFKGGTQGHVPPVESQAWSSLL